MGRASASAAASDDRTVFPSPYRPGKLDETPAEATASARYGDLGGAPTVETEVAPPAPIRGPSLRTERRAGAARMPRCAW